MGDYAKYPTATLPVGYFSIPAAVRTSYAFRAEACAAASLAIGTRKGEHET
jgi:hypothetical protein